MPFIKQEDQPLFEDIFWSKPQRQDQRPAVLIIGGHSQSLQAPLRAFQQLSRYDLEINVLLPSSLKAVLGKNAGQETFFSPSTPSGSFALGGLDQVLELATKCQCLFIAGDLSSNQETQQFVQQLLKQFKGLKVVTGKIIKSLLTTQPAQGLNLVCGNEQLPLFNRLVEKKLAWQAQLSSEALGPLLASWQLDFNLIYQHQNIIWVKAGDQVCATRTKNLNPEEVTLALAASCAYFLSIQSTKVWPALVSAAWQIKTHVK